MALIKRKAEGKYLIRVSKGTGAKRQFVNETFHGTLAEARAHAREIETAVHREPDDFKTKLLAALHDPLVAEAIGNALSNAMRRGEPSILRAVK